MQKRSKGQRSLKEKRSLKKVSLDLELILPAKQPLKEPAATVQADIHHTPNPDPHPQVSHLPIYVNLQHNMPV